MGVGVSTAGYALGRTIPSIDRYLLPVIGLVVVVSLLPIVWEAARARRRARDRRPDDLPTRSG